MMIACMPGNVEARPHLHFTRLRPKSSKVYARASHVHKRLITWPGMKASMPRLDRICAPSLRAGARDAKLRRSNTGGRSTGAWPCMTID
jgi:hypothetical protein